MLLLKMLSKSALTDKIGQALDDKRQTVANDWLNSAQDLEANKDASGLDNIAASTRRNSRGRRF